MTPTTAVTWKWIAGISMSILTLAGGSWMTTMYAEVNMLKQEQKTDRGIVGDIKTKVGVIDEQIKRTREEIQELKEGQREQIRKLDELLKRR